MMLFDQQFCDLIDPHMQKLVNDNRHLKAKIDLLLSDREEDKIVEEQQVKITEAQLVVHKDLGLRK